MQIFRIFMSVDVTYPTCAGLAEGWALYSAQLLLSSWGETTALLPVCKASRCVIKSELGQSLSELSLQGVLLWQQRLPLSVLLLLLLINPLQCSAACLNVLQWNALVLGSMHLLDSHPKLNRWKQPSERYLPLAPVHAEQGPACRMAGLHDLFCTAYNPRPERQGRAADL